MGYRIHSLRSLPIEDRISLYIFVIDGNLGDRFYEYLRNRFDQIARDIGENAVIAEGFDNENWGQEVLDAYFTEYTDGLHGGSYNELYTNLPALLITDTHPRYIEQEKSLQKSPLRLFVPLRDAEKKSGDLDMFIRELELFTKSQDHNFLDKFSNVTSNEDQSKDGLLGRHWLLVLQPNFFGLGLNINEFLDRLRSRNKSSSRDSIARR